MVTITRETASELTEMIEDSIEYWCQQSMENGELVSGETAYKILSAWADAKLAQFAGEVV